MDNANRYIGSPFIFLSPSAYRKKRHFFVYSAMMNEVSKHIKKQYFWDVDVSKLDLEASRRLIIERIFSLGDINDMQALISYYGKKEIINVLCGLNYLDPKTLNFVAKLFNTPKEEFRCYIRKPTSL